MLIVCPTCISAYRMPPDAHASALRCAQCGDVFDPAQPALSAAGAKDATSAIRAPDLTPGLHPFRNRFPPISPRSSRARVPVVLPMLVFAVALGMAGVAYRTRVAQALPGAAPLFAALGLPASSLSLGAVETELADEGPTKVLTLAGKITNALPTDAEVPNLRIVVRDDAETSIYSWVAPAPRARLGPGESVDFRSRLVSPPANGHDLVVSFADTSGSGPTAEVKTAR